MPAIRILFYQENGQSPVYEWMCKLLESDKKAYDNGIGRIRLLRNSGYQLRRPIVDYLRDGIYELRWKHGHVQYRVLYFFHGKDAAILTHGIVKEGSIDAIEIERAIRRRANFLNDPKAHGLDKELPNA